jgi:putative phage-type endonuclease
LNKKEWLEWRLQGVCASDAPVIMGVSPWKTRQELLNEKVTGFDGQPENDNMSFGKAREEEARLLFEEMTGHIVFPDRKVIHPEFSWIRATLDGLDLDEKIMVEIKCANKNDHLVATNKMVPAKYYPQCQHQMFVTGLPCMFYFSYHKKEGIIVEVKRNQVFIDGMFDLHKEFWDEVLELRQKLNVSA